MISMQKTTNETIIFINEEIEPVINSTIKNIEELILEESEKENSDNLLILDYKTGLLYAKKLVEFMKNYKPYNPK